MHQLLNYYCLTIINPKNLFNEAFEEVFRERNGYQNKNSIFNTFWLVPSLFTLDEEIYEGQITENIFITLKKNLEENTLDYPNCIDLISPNLNFVKWVALRTGSYLNQGNFAFNGEKLIQYKNYENNPTIQLTYDEYLENSILKDIPKTNQEIEIPLIYIDTDVKLESLQQEENQNETQTIGYFKCITIAQIRNIRLKEMYSKSHADLPAFQVYEKSNFDKLFEDTQNIQCLYPLKAVSTNKTILDLFYKGISKQC